MANKPIEWISDVRSEGTKAPEAEGTIPGAVERIVALLRLRAGLDFAPYKKSTICRRVERRMGIHRFRKIAQYVEFLGENPQEVDLLSRELLIGVTSFFRDPRAFTAFEEKALPALLAGRTTGRAFRAWVPACATGEEAYSLAIVLKEGLEAASRGGDSIKLFATDLDPDAVTRARQGVYPESIAADVSAERLRRFFVKDGSAYRVTRELRDTVIFSAHNVITDPPFTKLDFLSCRNLLIYLDRELQNLLMPLFHYSLNPGGVLFLGPAETAGGFPDLFTPIDEHWKLYGRRGVAASTPVVGFPLSSLTGETGEPEAGRHASRPAGRSFQERVDQALLRAFVPPSVLVNEEGDVLYLHGPTGKYLELPVGKANLNVFAMAPEGLRQELWSALHRAQTTRKPVRRKRLQVSTNGGRRLVNLTVKPFDEPRALRGLLLVIFEDVAAPRRRCQSPGESAARRDARPDRSEERDPEHRNGRNHPETPRQESHPSPEAFKSAVEELRSTNEGLRSTNEELTTSNEEMQSLNDELMAVNDAAQAKLEELSRARDGMTNLLNSTDIATLFLDKDLNVLRFTPQTTRIIRLISSDLGRPITDIASDLQYRALADDVNEVLEALVSKESDVAAKDGRWFQVRIMPYRPCERRVDGVVITFTEITAAKRLEEALRDAEQTARRQIDILDAASKEGPPQKEARGS